MTGRSLHDALLQVLGNGLVRSRLTHGDPTLNSLLGLKEYEVLKRLPSDHLHRMARFLARHYYRERIVRLFRHVRTLTGQTGRDPLTVLMTPVSGPILDRAVLGSPETARAILELIERYVTDKDEFITQHLPYWKDLVRYQAAMFLAEAAPAPEPHLGAGAPIRSSSATILDLDWDIPSVLSRLREGQIHVPQAYRGPTSLLIARSSRNRVTTVRCPKEIRCLIESLDGHKGVEALAQACRLSAQQVEQLLEQLSAIGAVLWR